MTKEQIKTIHVASGKAGLSEANYRTLLLNVAGVTTCKDLSQAGFEDCMATLEDLGYRHFGSPTYWRDKVANRGRFANPRMVWMIGKLYQDFQESRGDDDTHYELAGLVSRTSKGRTSAPAELSPREAWNLIESLKKIIARLTPAPSPGDPVEALDPVPF